MTHPLDVSELEPLQIVTSPPPAHALAPPLMSIAPPPPKHSAAADAAEMDTDPPPPDDVDAPAHIEKAPPVPLVLLPTMRLRLPPWDASAAPLLKDTSPLGPEHDEPDIADTDPLMPLAPASAEWTATEPLEVSTAPPLNMQTEPPVESALVDPPSRLVASGMPPLCWLSPPSMVNTPP